MVSPLLKEIFKTRKVYGDNNEAIPLGSNISPREGTFIHDLILDNNFTRCLEIGMANGISSLYICEALKQNSLKKEIKKEDIYLMSIDPFQSTQWKNAAVNNLKKAELDDFSLLFERKSYEVLPVLLENIKEGSLKPFDVILIDGMHLFDYTLVDFFFSELLLRKGGVILLDDIKHSNVRACYNYIKSNYLHYKLLNTISSDSIAAFVKIDDDKRQWFFHKPFCGKSFKNKLYINKLTS